MHRFEEVNARLQRIEDSIAALTSAFQSSAAARPPCLCSNPSHVSATSAPSPVHTIHSVSSPATTESLPATIAPHRRFHDTTAPDSPTPEALYLGASSILSMSNEAQLLAEEKVQAHAHSLTVRDKPRQIQGRQQKQVLEAMGSLRRLDTVGGVAGVIQNFEHRTLRDTAAKVEFKLPSREEAEECVRGMHLTWIRGCRGGMGRMMLIWVLCGGNRVFCKRAVQLPDIRGDEL